MAVLYFENLSGVKEDEYLRDGVTEDIITELSKIKGLRIFSRSSVLSFRDKQVAPAQVGQQLGAAYLLDRQPAARRRPAAHQRGARGHEDRLPALVGALRPRDEGRLRGAGRDRPQHRRGAARDAVAPGAGRARREAHRQPPGLRPVPARQELRATGHAAGRGVRAADVRERGHDGPRLRARPRRHRQRLRPALLPLAAHPGLDRAGQGRERAGECSGRRRARDPCGGSLDPVRRGQARRGRPPRPGRDRAPARLRGGLLPAGAGALRERPLPGGGARWRRPRWPPPARTTTSTSRSTTRSARSARRTRRTT